MVVLSVAMSLRFDDGVGGCDDNGAMAMSTSMTITWIVLADGADDDCLCDTLMESYGYVSNDKMPQ